MFEYGRLSGDLGVCSGLMSGVRVSSAHAPTGDHGDSRPDDCELGDTLDGVTRPDRSAGDVRTLALNCP